jgi:hypothetical protein
MEYEFILGMSILVITVLGIKFSWDRDDAMDKKLDALLTNQKIIANKLEIYLNS